MARGENGYIGPTNLPREAYLSQDVYEQEIRKVLHRQWLLVGHVNSVRNPGDYFVKQVGPESIIFTRDKGGKVRAYFNVCRHRGFQMFEKGAKGCGEGIVCPYHKWTYDLDGALRRVPGSKNGQDFNFGDFPLHEAQVGSWEGWLFVWLGTDPAPSLESALNGFGPPEKLRAAGSHNLKLAHREEYLVNANWKSMMENDMECYHCAHGGHPSLAVSCDYQAFYLDHEKGQAHEGDKYFPLRDGMATLSMDGARVSNIPLAPGGNDGDSAGFLLWPMFCGVAMFVDHAVTFELFPLAPDRTLFASEWYVHEDAVEGVDYDPHKVAELFHKTNLEDAAFGETNYKGIKSARFVPGPVHPRREAGVLMAYDAYHRMMAAD